MKITFDSGKRETTIRERRLDFARADEIFAGRVYTAQDTRFDYPETRFITVGHLDDRMIVFVWTPSEDGARVISMRKANDREQKRFARHFSMDRS